MKGKLTYQLYSWFFINIGFFAICSDINSRWKCFTLVYNPISSLFSIMILLSWQFLDYWKQPLIMDEQAARHRPALQAVQNDTVPMVPGFFQKLPGSTAAGLPIRRMKELWLTPEWGAQRGRGEGSLQTAFQWYTRTMASQDQALRWHFQEFILKLRMK